MLSHKIAYYGLLCSLVALLALGLQPVRFGKVALAQKAAPEQEPEEESGDEEESESVGASSRRESVCHAVDRDSAAIPHDGCSSPIRFRPGAPRILNGELSARNGCGGPLRL